MKKIQKIMFFIFLLFLTCLAEEKVISLFNGKDLTNWEITDFGTQGPVSVNNGQLILGMGEGCTGVTWKGTSIPKNNYQISLQAKRISGNDFFCGLTFPVNENFLTLVVGGWGGTVVGLSCLDGLDASENETSSMKNFQKNRWYEIKVQIKNNSVEAWIDGIKLVHGDIKGRELSLRPEVILSKPFGITSWYTKSALKDIKVIILDDENRAK